MRYVALPELPRESLHVADHRVLEVETRVPAQRPVPEHPEFPIRGHGAATAGAVRRRRRSLYCGLIRGRVRRWGGRRSSERKCPPVP